MTPNIDVVRSPPSCQRCGHPLPDGPDPLRRSPGPVGRRHSGEFHPPSPVRVVRPSPDGELQILYWCSSRHYKADHAKPAKKTKKGRPTPDSYFHIRPRAA